MDHLIVVVFISRLRQYHAQITFSITYYMNRCQSKAEISLLLGRKALPESVTGYGIQTLTAPAT